METAKINYKKNKLKRTLLIIVSLLIIARIILPHVLLYYANKKLASIDGYFGHIDDLDLNIYRGAYIIKDVYIDKVDSISQTRTPFVSTQTIDLSVEWKSLFKGRFVGEIELNNPVVRFTKDKAEPESIQNDTADFRNVLKTFMPLKINRLEINNGKIQYIDSTSSPMVDVSITQLHVLAENLSSVLDTALLPAKVVANANVYKGNLDLRMKLNPLAQKPTFDLNAELKSVNLPELNNFLKAYTNFDVHAGTFGLYTEVAAKEGKFIGYVKPIIKDLKVVGTEDKKDSFINKLYEQLIATAGFILKNPEEEQVATKVPLVGEYGETNVHTWYAVIEVLRNAFVQALFPSLDNEININTVNKEKLYDKKSLLEKILTKSDRKEGVRRVD